MLHRFLSLSCPTLDPTYKFSSRNLPEVSCEARQPNRLTAHPTSTGNRIRGTITEFQKSRLAATTPDLCVHVFGSAGNRLFIPHLGNESCNSGKEILLPYRCTEGARAGVGSAQAAFHHRTVSGFSAMEREPRSSPKTLHKSPFPAWRFETCLFEDRLSLKLPATPL